MAFIGLLVLGANCWLVLDVRRDLTKVALQLDEQGRKVGTLYNFLGEEIGFEELEADPSVPLELVNEFRDVLFMSKAKFGPVDHSFGAVVGDGTVKLFDAETGDVQKTLREPNELVNSIAFSPDGTSFLSGTRSGKLFLWDPVTGSSRLVTHLANRAIARLDWGGDGQKLPGD